MDTVSEKDQIWLSGGHYYVYHEIIILVTEPIFNPTFFPLLINKVQMFNLDILLSVVVFYFCTI